jgi:hypothetical protein
MPADSEHRHIEAAILGFARAYQRLEELQQQEAAKPAGSALLPGKGDQKTGLIGEYWAMRYARTIYPGSMIEFGGHSQPGWDLKVIQENAPALYLQIKTVSQFGEGKLSAICPPANRSPADSDNPGFWNELWLVKLDRQFQPIILWRLRPEHVRFGEKKGRLKHTTMRGHPSQKNTGSVCFAWDQAEAVLNLRERVEAN